MNWVGRFAPAEFARYSMATKAQFDFFNGMYNEQTDRRKNIQERAKFYFTIVSFYFGVILFKIQDVADTSKLSRTERWFSIASAVVLSASLVFYPARHPRAFL
jgi:hypothetical protein